MELFRFAVGTVGDFVWGPAMILLLTGTGFYLTLKLGFIQIKGFPHSFALVSGLHSKKDEEGEVSHYQALSAALAATIGTGNIAGVATAIAAGGPGAVFWMWVTAFVGMATKFAEATLAQKYRKISEDGSISGGPMYYLEYGLKARWAGMLFAALTVTASFGIGNMVQANSVAKPLEDLAGIPALVSGLIMSVLTALVILGGIKRIGTVSGALVPFMSVFYILGSMVIIILNIDKLGSVLYLIISSAFSPASAAGGFAGATVAQAIRFGVARGVFSNEAGLGSAPIIHAASRTSEPVREGLVASLGPFIDTIIVCTMTALVILISDAWMQVDEVTGKALTGATLSAVAFQSALPGIGAWIVKIGIALFAFSTILGWSYYGDRSIEYLFGKKYIRLYHLVWVILIPVGATAELDLIWSFSDAANGLMAIPNLIALLLLSGVVAREMKKYTRQHMGPKSGGAA